MATRNKVFMVHDGSCTIPSGDTQRNGAAKRRLDRAILSAKIDVLMDGVRRLAASQRRRAYDAAPAVYRQQHSTSNYERICLEAERAYAARNPHKKG